MKQRGIRCADLISTECGLDACEAFYKNGFVFNYDGKVYKCAMKLDDPSNCIAQLTPNGTMIFDHEREKVWEKRGKIERKCLKCIFYPICLSNRCHYQEKIKNKLECLECRGSIDEQIQTMISKKKYIIIEV